jgi:hypothetical protein
MTRSKPKESRAQQAIDREQENIVTLLAQDNSEGRYQRVATTLGTSSSKCQYWEMKSLDPHFHATKRNFADEQATFKSFELKLVQKAVIVILEGEHRFLPEIKQLENQYALLQDVWELLDVFFDRKVSKSVLPTCQVFFEECSSLSFLHGMDSRCSGLVQTEIL